MSVNYIDKSTGDLIRVAGGGNDILYADAPVGSIIPFGGTTAPDGFLLCQGQAVSRTTYAELFAVIGTSFGGGDGSTTFNVPDLREATTKGVGLSGKSSNHYDSDGVALGEFVEDRIKSHTHSMNHTHTFSGTTGGMNSNASHTHTTTGFESVNVQKSGFGYTSFLNGTGTQTTNATDTNHTHNYSGTTSGASTSTTSSTGSATTEVKAVGVNYIIKAIQVDAPADFAPVDVIENGNMKAVTSNAVYDALNREVRKGTSASVTISAGYFTSTVGIIFDSPMPDADYEVILYNTQGMGSQWSDFIPCVKSKTVNGFEVQFNTLGNTPVASGLAITCNIAYTAFKL